MNLRLKQIIQLVTLVLMGSVATAFAEDVAISTPGLSGYDPVAYFTDGKAIRGSGFHVTVQNGVTYAFASKEHKPSSRRPLRSTSPFTADIVPTGSR